MMKWFWGLILVSSFVLAQDAAVNQFFYLGGAGDPLKNPTTIFDTGIKNLIQFCKDSTWVPDIRFDGGHAESEKLLKAEIKAVPDQSNFDPNSYKVSLAKMKAKAQGLPDGSKMLIFVDSHGADRPDYVKLKTHQIAISSGEVLDATTLVGIDLVDLDGLKDVIDLANARHLQIAVIDMSCHSGFSQSLANDQTCVITSTSSDLFGYGDFSDVFTEKMKKGKNLESIFLDTREKIVEGALPQISTPAGQYLSAMEDHTLSRFMANKGKEQNADNLTDLLKTEAESCVDCDVPSLRLVDAKAKLKLLSNDLSEGESDAEFKKLQTLLEKYQGIQSDIEAQLKAIGYGRLNTPENIEVKYTNAFGKPDSMVSHLTWESLLLGAWESTQQSFTKDIQNAKNKYDRIQAQASYDLVTASLKRRDEILKQYPQMKDYKVAGEKVLSQVQNSEDLVNEIAKQERVIYKKVYEQKSKGSEHNACKDFVL